MTNPTNKTAIDVAAGEASKTISMPTLTTAPPTQQSSLPLPEYG